MAEGDPFADELSDALARPAAPRRSAPPATATPPPATPRPPVDAPEVLRNRSFHSLFGEYDAGEAWGAPPEATPGGSPAIVVRDDPASGLLELHAGAPGPAGEASLELEGGVTLSVDAAAPRRLTSVLVDRHGPGGRGVATTLGGLLPPFIAHLVARGAAPDGGWHRVPVPDERATDLDALGRYVLLCDEATAMPSDGYREDNEQGGVLPRLALRLEALTHVPRSLRFALGDQPLRWARQAAVDLLEVHGVSHLTVPDGPAADQEALHELATGLRVAAHTLVGSDGPQRMADRRLGRRLGAVADDLADRLGQASPRPAARVLPPRPHTRGPAATGGSPAVVATASMRDRHPVAAAHLVAQATLAVVGHGELEILVPVPGGRERTVLPDRLWGRVTRRHNAVPLALTALRPDPSEPDVRRGRVVLPTDLLVADVLIDLTDDPTEPVPTEGARRLAEAVAAGRDACQRERRHQSTEATAAWIRCAEAWTALGDTERAAVARRYAASADHPGQVRPFLADRLR